MKTTAMARVPAAIGTGTLAWAKHFVQSAAPALGWALLAVAALGAGYTWDQARPLIILYLLALLQLAREERWRLAFYPGLAVGFLVGVLRLNFFFTIFSWAAVALWLVFAVWIGLFTALARLALRRFGERWCLLLLPVLWTGLEYFRSELYYLRFAWLTPGYAFASAGSVPVLNHLGVYGIGFLLVGLVWATQLFRGLRTRVLCVAALMGAVALLPLVPRGAVQTAAGQTLKVAGVQMEFPSEVEVLSRLRELLKKHPDVQLVVLPEYTFQGPVPKKVKDWCRSTGRYLIAGGKEPAGKEFYNAAYVIGPKGEVVFRQDKRVPIQFFQDGLPAERQQLWASPWGKIGICICYDLSYTRVTDALVRQGAEALIVPTMDVADWGLAQHELHGKVAPVRAAEYGLPIFRLASSGISQHVNARGEVLASAPFPGDGAVLAGSLEFRGAGSVPAGRYLAPVCVGATLLLITLFVVDCRRVARARVGLPA